MSAEVVRERIDPNALDRLTVSVERVELTTPLSVTEISPVGRLVASACKARLLDEGFQQDGTIRVASLPVLSQASADQGKDTRGEITTLYPWQDEKARVIDDQVQVTPAVFGRPADALIAWFDFPGARAEAEQSDDLAGSTHEVAQLRSGHKLVTEVMMPLDVGIPQ